MSTLTAYAVLEAPGGYVAYRLQIPQKGPMTREPLCDPCHKSLAYQYLSSKIQEDWVRGMIAEAGK